MPSNRLLRLSGIVLLLAFALVGSAGAGGTPSLGPAGIQGSYWQIETVRGPESGEHNSLAIDSMGVVQASFYDRANQDLIYARKEPCGQWASAVVDAPGDVGRGSALALDGANYPHISYFDASGTALKYAHWSQTASWSIEQVDGDVDPGDSSLVLSPSGSPAIAYYDPLNRDLKYAAKGISLWEITVVDSEGNVGSSPSMVLDSFGRAHISYYDKTNGDLKHAAYVGSGGNCGGGKWDCEVVDSAGEVGWYTAIAVDSFDRLYVSYYDLSNQDLKLASRFGSGGNCGGGAWYCEVVDSAGEVGRYTDIALSGYGEPRISYLDDSSGMVKYAWRLYDWSTMPVARTTFDAWPQTSLVVDAAGRPHITYVGPGVTLQHAYLAPYAAFLPVVRRH